MIDRAISFLTTWDYIHEGEIALKRKRATFTGSGRLGYNEDRDRAVRKERPDIHHRWIAVNVGRPFARRP